MADTLVIQLPNTPANLPWWVIVDEKNQLIDHAQQTSWEEIVSHSQGKRVFVLVPTMDVLLFKADLPLMKATRLHQAVPFALEDQLIEPVENYHFVIAPQQTTSPFCTAVVLHSKMKAWLETLHAAGITPHVMTADVFAIPYAADHWYVVICQEKTWIRTDAYHGYQCDTNNITLMLNLALQENPSPQGITIYQYGNTEIFNAPLLQQHLKIPFEHQIFSQDKLFTDMAQCICQQPLVNLLYAPYQVNKEKYAAKQLWLLTLGCLGALIALIFFNNLITYLYNVRQENKIKQHIETIYRRYFPEATTTVAPQQRLQEHLNQLQSQLSGNTFLQLLSQLGQTLNQFPALTVISFSYQERQLTAKITATNFQQTQTVLKQLQQQGIAVKQTSATTQDGKVTVLWSLQG